MNYLQCGACGALVTVPTGSTVEQASADHVQSHDAADLRAYTA